MCRKAVGTKKKENGSGPFLYKAELMYIVLARVWAHWRPGAHDIRVVLALELDKSIL